MNLKTIAAFAAASIALSASATEGVTTLDLSRAMTEFTFDAKTGAWNQTFSDEEPTIDSQLYCFMHYALPSYQTWWGFTASNSVDNMPQTDWITYQYSNMAKGGIALNEDGTIKVNEQGAPVSDPKVPYLVAYYNKYMSRKPVQILTNDGEAHEAIGCYVNLNSYPYYTTLLGDSFARAFTEGDKLTLTINGVTADNTTKKIDVVLASFTNGQYTAATGWMYVDLTSLGAVNEIYFTMDSTDTGSWGMNTPGYFCLDKLMMKTEVNTSVATVGTESNLKYNRAEATLTATPGMLIGVYTAEGQLMMSSDNGVLSLNGAESGVYVARCGNRALKIMI